MSYIIPKLWKLIQHLDCRTSLTFTDLEKRGFNPKTLTKYLQLALENGLIKKQGQAYSLTGMGVSYFNLLTQLGDLISFPKLLERVPRKEIHQFLQIHATQLKDYYG